MSRSLFRAVNTVLILVIVDYSGSFQKDFSAYSYLVLILVIVDYSGSDH